MRLYRVVTRSGTNMEFMAKVMVDNPAASDSIDFYQDETLHHLVSTIKRDQVAGMILFPHKANTIPIPRF